MEPIELHFPSTINETPNSILESDDSISEFEMNLRKLMPDLLGGLETNTSVQPKGTRRSKRIKKPSSCFNEETSYLTIPTKSSKKKVPQGDSAKVATSKPILIFDWTNTQLASYCDACGISFTDSMNECFNHIRLLEQSHVVPSHVSVSSLEDCVA